MGFYSTTEFHPDSSLGYLARRVHQLTQAGLEPVFAAEGLTNIQWQALISIYFHPGSNCAALARDLSYDKGATTRLLDILDDNGWVTRERGRDDRRLVGLSLTEAGERVMRHVRQRVIDAWDGWLSDWPDSEVNGALMTMQRLRDTLLAKMA